MFNNTTRITVDSTDYDYGLVNVQNSQSLRLNAAVDIGEPDSLSISHEKKGSGQKAVSRHLIRIDTTKRTVDANGTAVDATTSVYVVLVVPAVNITQADVKLAYDKLVTLIGATEAGASSSNFVRVLSGEGL